MITKFFNTNFCRVLFDGFYKQKIYSHKNEIIAKRKEIFSKQRKCQISKTISYITLFVFVEKIHVFCKKCTPSRKHSQELLCKVRAPRFLWKLHVDFNFSEGHEKNIISLRAAAQISECCKIRSNCKTHISSWCKHLNKKKLRTALVLIKSPQHRQLASQFCLYI